MVRASESLVGVVIVALLGVLALDLALHELLDRRPVEDIAQVAVVRFRRERLQRHLGEV